MVFSRLCSLIQKKKGCVHRGKKESGHQNKEARSSREGEKRHRQETDPFAREQHFWEELVCDHRQERMGNRQCKAPFDVRDNMSLYHQHARNAARRRQAYDDDDNTDKLKRALFQSQFGRDMDDDSDCAKLVWFAVTKGRVPIVITPTSPTLREVEWGIIPNAANAVDSDACEYPMLSVVVLAKAGDSPIKERMHGGDFYESINEGERIAWKPDRIGCCFCRCAC
nr:hypothetical protein [Pandoravirus massiliensis]